MRKLQKKLYRQIAASQYKRLFDIESGGSWECLNFVMETERSAECYTHVLISEEYKFDLRQKDLWNTILNNCKNLEFILQTRQSFSIDIYLPDLVTNPRGLSSFKGEEEVFRLNVSYDNIGNTVFQYFKVTDEFALKYLFSIIPIYELGPATQTLKLEPELRTALQDNLASFYAVVFKEMLSLTGDSEPDEEQESSFRDFGSEFFRLSKMTWKFNQPKLKFSHEDRTLISDWTNFLDEPDEHGLDPGIAPLAYKKKYPLKGQIVVFLNKVQDLIQDGGVVYAEVA